MSDYTDREAVARIVTNIALGDPDYGDYAAADCLLDPANRAALLRALGLHEESRERGGFDEVAALEQLRIQVARAEAAERKVARCEALAGGPFGESRMDHLPYAADLRGDGTVEFVVRLDDLRAALKGDDDA